jgi:hypothetical protein
MNWCTFLIHIIKKCWSLLQQRKEEETIDTPKIVGDYQRNRTIPKQPKYQYAFIEEIIDEEEFKMHTLNPLDEDKPSILTGLLDSMEPEEVWINAWTNVPVTELAIKMNKKKEKIPMEELIPQEYHKYLDIFDEE